MDGKIALWLAGLVLVCSSFAALAQPGGGEPVYRFDPALSVESPAQSYLSADPQSIVVIEKDREENGVHLRAETPVSPYLEAERGPELSPEEERLLAGNAEGGSLPPDYRLEAGIGLYARDRARLNLGYRLQSQSPLPGEHAGEPFTLTGDLRITFDIKVPF